MNSKLLKKILADRRISYSRLAKEVGISRIVLHLKMLGIIEFNAAEIMGISEILQLCENQVEEIFFGL